MFPFIIESTSKWLEVGYTWINIWQENIMYINYKSSLGGEKNITRKQLDRFIIIIYRKYNYISMYLESTKYFTNISLGRTQISS